MVTEALEFSWEARTKKTRESGPGRGLARWGVRGLRKLKEQFFLDLALQHSFGGGGMGHIFLSDSCLSLSLPFVFLPHPFLFVILSMRYDISRFSRVEKKTKTRRYQLFPVLVWFPCYSQKEGGGVVSVPNLVFSIKQNIKIEKFSCVRMG